MSEQEEYGEFEYAACADELNDPYGMITDVEDLDEDYRRLGEAYAKRHGLAWPPVPGDFDRYYERKMGWA